MVLSTAELLILILTIAIIVVIGMGKKRAGGMAGWRACRACGTAHPLFARFCRRCGQRLP